MTTKLPYQEGDWFVVPLRTGGYALGLIARSPKRGKILFGYFFGPRRRAFPSLIDARICQSDDAIFAAIFGDLGLINGDWQILGREDVWDRNQWPLPFFARVDSISGNVSLIKYSEETIDEIGIMPGKAIDVERYPEDGLWGFGALEIRLTQLLDVNKDNQ